MIVPGHGPGLVAVGVRNVLTQLAVARAASTR